MALLSFCILAGVVTGNLLGTLIGIEANVGGVGIAMLLLFLTKLSSRKFQMRGSRVFPSQTDKSDVSC